MFALNSPQITRVLGFLNYSKTYIVTELLNHLCKDASDLYCGLLYIDVSCCYKETKCNSQSPHLEQGRSLGHILTFTPESPQINSIYVCTDPLQTLSHLSSQPDSVFQHVNHGELSYKGIPCDSLRAVSRVT